jgi:hypothetical protein
MAAAWMDAIPWIDFAVNGEADLAFPALLRSLCRGGNPLAVPGESGGAPAPWSRDRHPFQLKSWNFPSLTPASTSIARRT